MSERTSLFQQTAGREPLEGAPAFASRNARIVPGSSESAETPGRHDAAVAQGCHDATSLEPGADTHGAGTFGPAGGERDIDARIRSFYGSEPGVDLHMEELCELGDELAGEREDLLDTVWTVLKRARSFDHAAALLGSRRVRVSFGAGGGIEVTIRMAPVDMPALRERSARAVYARGGLIPARGSGEPPPPSRPLPPFQSRTAWQLARGEK